MTLILSAIFLVSLAIAAASAYHLIRQELAARVDSHLSDTFAVISQSFGDNDISDLVASVDSHAGTTIDHDQIFRLTDASGKVVAGNLPGMPVPTGWATLDAEELGLPGHADYRTLSGIVGKNNLLLVGSSSTQSEAIGQLTLATFAWAALIFIGLVVSAGVVIAVRAQRRLDGIAGTMRRIGQGELTARIPVSRRDDDVDSLSRQVNIALDRLAALVEGMRQISVDIAHDLKTPLNRLSITIESAIEAEQTHQPLDGLLSQAQDEGQQINATFDALLRIAQIEAGARRSRFAQQELPAILDAIVEIYGEVAIERGQTLKLLAPEGPVPPILGDRELLIQLCANLVQNALHHGPPGVSVTLSVTAQAQGALVTIADTGPGIPESEREMVFRRLYRLDKSRTTPGSGLGLSLAKAIVDLHGGTIVLGDNHPGLRVEISFPALAVSAQGVSGRGWRPPNATHDPGAGNRR
jgi:signal transduction histidine kinase